MKTHGLRALLVAGMAAMLLLAGATVVQAGAGRNPAGQGSIFAQIVPAAPTELDDIELVVHFTLPHPCFTFEVTSFDVTADSVRLSMRATEQASCQPQPSNFDVTRDAGKLAAGRYDVDADIDVEQLCQGRFCGGFGMGMGFDFQVAKVGDANCDGSVNSIDAVLVLQFDARLTTSLTCLDAADVNEDGTVNSIDAALILQYEACLLRVCFLR